jgi:hypothetical protein
MELEFAGIFPYDGIETAPRKHSLKKAKTSKKEKEKII